MSTPTSNQAHLKNELKLLFDIVLHASYTLLLQCSQLLMMIVGGFFSLINLVLQRQPKMVAKGYVIVFVI